MAVWIKDEERQYIVKKIADLLEESSDVARSRKSPDKMEKAIFEQAKSKEEYMSMAGRLLVSIKQEGLQAQMFSTIQHSISGTKTSGSSDKHHPGIHVSNISSNGHDIQHSDSSGKHHPGIHGSNVSSNGHDIQHSDSSGKHHPGIHGSNISSNGHDIQHSGSGNIQSSNCNDIQHSGSGNIQVPGNDIQHSGSGNIHSSNCNDIQHPGSNIQHSSSGNIQTHGDGGVTSPVHSGQHTNGGIQPQGISTLKQPVSTSQMASGNLTITDKESCYVTLVTCPSIEVAKTLSRGVVENKLAACVNIVPQVISIFEWEGKIEEEQELLMIIKSSNSKLKMLASYIEKNHPYDVPEVISTKIEEGSTSYLDWIRKTCSPTT